MVLDLLHRRAARGAGLDELESGVAHAPSAGLAAGDDGFVVPQLGDGAGDGAPVAVEERDDAPHRCPGKRVSSGCSGIVVEKRVQAAVDAVRSAAGLLAPAATGGQCTVIAVGQYSTLKWCISASSSRSW